MIEYEQTDGCRMEYLQRALDDETAVPCGRCDNCAGAWFPVDVRQEAAAVRGQLPSTGSASSSSRAPSGRRARRSSGCP